MPSELIARFHILDESKIEDLVSRIEKTTELKPITESGLIAWDGILGPSFSVSPCTFQSKGHRITKYTFIAPLRKYIRKYQKGEEIEPRKLLTEAYHDIKSKLEGIQDPSLHYQGIILLQTTNYSVFRKSSSLKEIDALDEIDYF